IPNIPVDARWVQNGMTVAGGHGWGTFTNQLNCPRDLFIDDDQTMVIVDWWNHRIIQWTMGDSNGQVIAGGNRPGNRLDQLDRPTDVLIDKETDSLIICDGVNRRVTETTSDTINGNDCIELTLSPGTNTTSSQLTRSDQLYLIHDNDDDIYPAVKVTLGGELPENATESENKDNDNDKKKIIEKQEQSSISKSKCNRERNDDKELLSLADEEENRPTSSTPSPPPPTTAEKTKVKKSSSETTTIVFTNTSVPLLLNIMMDDIHPTNQSDNSTIEYLINPDSLTARVDKLNIIETDRIEFKLNLPCSRYLRRKTIDSQE
ncbi:unnamed protein product, partial [Rotaria sordida]